MTYSYSPTDLQLLDPEPESLDSWSQTPRCIHSSGYHMLWAGPPGPTAWPGQTRSYTQQALRGRQVCVWGGGGGVMLEEWDSVTQTIPDMICHPRVVYQVIMEP